MFQSTKKFFKRSIQTVKSYFSDGYQKLPKSPPYNGHQNANFSLETVYSEFVDQWEASDRIMATSWGKDTNNLRHRKPSMLIDHHKVERQREQKHKDRSSRGRDEKRSLVTRRLKELEIFDKDNAEHVHDVQEILHCYSRLTCPVYCEIVEIFFLEMYSEVFTPRRLSIQV